MQCAMSSNVFYYDFPSSRLLCLLQFVLMLSSTDATTHNVAYFNSSLGSQINISSVLSFRNLIVFSFSTCSPGQLIFQSGRNEDFYRMYLTENGSLRVNWKSDSHLADSFVFNDLILTDNEWYTVESSFSLGNIYVKVGQGSNIKANVLLSNSTYRSYLWDLNLTDGSPIQVGGDGFSGCIKEGAQILLSSPSVSAFNVQWDHCPLEDSSGCGTPVQNPCWTYPCQNDGTCLSSGDGSSFRCQCSRTFTGAACEVDMSSHGCEMNPCLNNATCQSTNSTSSRNYLCICLAGFAGTDCEINKNECVSSPCRNGGQCLDGINSFACNCSDTGFTGVRCQTNINECAADVGLCLNGSTCIDTPGSFKCDCSPGFSGIRCQNQRDDCISNPCLNSGTCQPLVGYYNCHCMAGFTGNNCEVNIDDCVGVSCPGNHTTCVDGVLSYSCQCLPGYHDLSNSSVNATNCEDINECSSDPCVNGSTCVNGKNNYTCQCAPGYTGRRCDTDINECLLQPCQNNGICKNFPGSYRCLCSSGFTGYNCSTNIDDCASSPCQNGAACYDLVNRFECNCTGGWTGNLCQIDIDECASQPCRNNGTCKNFVDYYNCTCLQGFQGMLCEVNVNDCNESFCLNNGTCIDGVNSYSCQCTDDWMGRNCSAVYDSCAMNLCQNGATCESVPPSHNYTCSCASGFTGHSCEININDCQNSSCPLYQVCFDGINNFSCACPLGVTGSRCDVEIDDCLSNPCLNGATCIDGRNNYSCVCNSEVVNLTVYTNDPKSVFRIGYTGTQCEHLINACMYNLPSICLNKGRCQADENSTDTFGFYCYCPNIRGQYYSGRFCHQARTPCDLAKDSSNPVCQNGGTCVPIGDSYFCSCAPGYTGVKCQHDIDECESSPCHYNGTCVDLVNRYTCQCPNGTSGFNCETNIDECSSQPCLNGGQCIDLLNAFSNNSLNNAVSRYWCNCSGTGYLGVNCETDIDECLSQPCLHNSTCYNGLKMYNCTCFDGYNGTNCGIDIDECLSSPCQNNGTCHQRSNSSRSDFSYATAAGFYCDCPVGFTGGMCETNIDECLSTPCTFGYCQDHVNGYTCHCYAGYRGINCETEIDECLEYSPCQNNGTCHDRVAGYDCVCVWKQQQRQMNGKLFGGKNCSVELVGCKSNACHNGATCWPVLANETLNVHDFSCLCPSGFSGRLCNISTTMSFGVSSQLVYLYNASNPLSVSFDFRTTLRSVALLYLESNTTRAILKISDFPNQRLIFEKYSSQISDGHLMINCPGQKVLNDGSWHRVLLNFSVLEVSLQLVDPDCSSKFNCTDSMQFNYSQLSNPVFQFGGDKSDIFKTDGSKAFVGCMQDIHLNEDTFVPAESNESLRFMSRGVLSGCPRTDQCNPNPCYNKGNCEDLWTSYKCVCKRPFVGTNCTKTYSAATFGLNNGKSCAQFFFSTKLQNSLNCTTYVSFFFRTRSSDGLLFYAGSNASSEIETNETYQMVRLIGGELWSQMKSEEGDFQCHVTSGNLADGQQHFVDFLANSSSLRVLVDNTATDCVVNSSCLSFISTFFVGGLPLNHNYSGQNTESGVAVPYYHGTVQDLRIFDRLVQFFPTNESEAFVSEVIEPSILSEVLQGEVSSDICRTQQPCANNATCIDVFFDDFQCQCDEQFQGRNCSELNYCIYNSCPSGGFCRSLSDGYECLSNATFNGMSSILRYSYTLNQLVINDISAVVRTRNRNGTILLIQHGSQPSVCSIAFRLFNSQIVLQVNYSPINQSKSLSMGLKNNQTVMDGSEHKIQAAFGWDHVQFFIDDSIVQTSPYDWGEISSSCNFSSNDLEVLVGGMKEKDGIPSTQEPDFFKGCMAELRINGILMPFFNASQMKNNTSPKRFDLKDSVDVLIGCVGDDVCGVKSLCQNGATCEDIWNAFNCSCSPGFSGDLCSVNIDDCVDNTCLNNATCLDGVTNYSCACINGFTGLNCETDIDECLSSPCLNGGTCFNNVNQFSCTCTTGFLGLRCELPGQDDCETHLCQNNGTCVSDGVSKKCICPNQYSGRNCEHKIDACANNTCSQNTSTCHPLFGTLNYSCICMQGYTGINCSEDIDECIIKDFCLNGGNCSNVPGSYSCTCPSNWMGSKCETPLSMASHGLTPNEIGIIVGVILGTALLAVIIAVIVFLVIARKKRATHGTYSPSWQEMIGSRVDTKSALKLPPEERLI